MRQSPFRVTLASVSLDVRVTLAAERYETQGRRATQAALPPPLLSPLGRNGDAQRKAGGAERCRPVTPRGAQGRRPCAFRALVVRPGRMEAHVLRYTDFDSDIKVRPPGRGQRVFRLCASRHEKRTP